MSNQAIKELERSGLSISKDKLLDLIKKSNQQTFTFSQNQGSKQIIVAINC